MSFAILGGILLIIGAYLTFEGKIYASVIVYLVADICWIVMAYEQADIWGVVSIGVGILFGILAFIKMYRGKMSKNLMKDDDGL